MKFSLLLVFFCINVFSYIPSVESLFRNGGNADISANTVVLNIHVEKLKTDTETSEAPSPEVDANGEPILKVFNSGFFKLLYTKDSESAPIKLVQVGYKNESMKKEEIISLKYLSSFSKFPSLKGVESTEQGLFYSLINSLALNDGHMMIDFLRSRGVSVKFNKEIINKEKVHLLGQYKNYLQKVKDDPTLKESLESPLSPKDSEQRIKVKEQIKDSFFHENSIVKRVKEKNKFYWKVETENFTAKFENETRHLVDLELQTTWGGLAVQCKDYIIFDGVHEFPKYVYFKDFQGNYYQIKMLSMKQFNDKGTSYDRRYKKYQESLGDNQVEKELVTKPSFVL